MVRASTSSTPIASLRGYGEALWAGMLGPLNEKQTRAPQTVAEHTASGAALVNCDCYSDLWGGAYGSSPL